MKSARIRTTVSSGFALACLLSCGCTDQTNRGPGGPSAPTPPDHSAAREVQKQRLVKLALFRSGGVIELQWQDDRGSHREQGDINLRMHLPHQLALSVNKQVSDPFIWLGSNSERFWFFDLMDRDEKVAYVGRYDDVNRSRDIPGVIHPLRLLDLCGLTEFPELSELSFDADEQAWIVACSGRGGLMRVWLEIGTLLPVRVDSIDADGHTLFRSRLSRYQSVPIANAPRGAFPKMPVRIEITDLNGGGVATVTMDGLTTELDAAKVAAACDFEQLSAVLGPDRIIDLANEIDQLELDE